MQAKRAICLMLLTLAMSAGCGSMNYSPGRYNATRFPATERVEGRPPSLAAWSRESARIGEEILDEALRSHTTAVAQVTDLKYAEAAAGFAALIPRLEASGAWTHAAEAIFWLGFCQEKTGQGNRARATYQRLQGAYPKTPAARQATGRLKRLAAPATDK